MARFFKTIIVACFLASAFSPVCTAETLEDSFDRNRTEPLSLMQKYYHTSDILFLENSNHFHWKIYKQILDLLMVVGDDPNLKYIVLERFHDASDFYEDLSVHPLESAINKFKSPYAMNNSLCQSSEWAYTISKFMPEIRKINKRRPKENPLLVTSIDGLSANNDILWPANPTAQEFDINLYFKTMTYKTVGACENPISPAFLSNSRTREQKTAVRFSQFTKRLGSHGKAIVMYHHGHAMPLTSSCSPELSSDLKWVYAPGNLSWYQIFLDKNPQFSKKIKTILFDEIDGAYNKSGVLQISRKEADRFPDADYGLEIKKIAGLVGASGMDLFEPDAMVKTYNQSFTTAPLEKIFDGLIWNHDSALNFKLDERSSIYLPTYCH